MVLPLIRILYIQLFNTFNSTTPIPAAARSLASVCGRLPVEFVISNSTGPWTSVCSERCVLSGRGLCDELITPKEEFYRLWCVVLCDLETTRMRKPRPIGGVVASKIKKNNTIIYDQKSPSNDYRSQISLRRRVTLSEVFLSKIRHFWCRTVGKAVTLNLSPVTE
jgi:hypothetical protein